MGSILPDMFVDPQLRARQDQMDAQWSSLNGTINSCDAFPDAAWVQFVNDLRNWRDFYAGGNDWSSASKHATDDWQTKLQSWTTQVASWCVPGASDPTYIPTVKDPPPDQPSTLQTLLGEVKSDVAAPFVWVEDVALKIGIGLAVLVVLIIVAIVVVLVKGNVKTGPGGISV